MKNKSGLYLCEIRSLDCKLIISLDPQQKLYPNKKSTLLTVWANRRSFARQSTIGATFMSIAELRISGVQRQISRTIRGSRRWRRPLSAMAGQDISDHKSGSTQVMMRHTSAHASGHFVHCHPICRIGCCCCWGPQKQAVWLWLGHRDFAVTLQRLKEFRPSHLYICCRSLSSQSHRKFRWMWLDCQLYWHHSRWFCKSSENYFSNYSSSKFDISRWTVDLLSKEKINILKNYTKVK